MRGGPSIGTLKYQSVQCIFRLRVPPFAVGGRDNDFGEVASPLGGQHRNPAV